MTKTIAEIHEDFVRALMARGEEVVMPKGGMPFKNVLGYVKSDRFPQAGYISFSEKRDCYELDYDFQCVATWLSWEDIGLCDSACWYEWRQMETDDKLSVKIDFAEKVVSLEKIIDGDFVMELNDGTTYWFKKNDVYDMFAELYEKRRGSERGC